MLQRIMKLNALMIADFTAPFPVSNSQMHYPNAMIFSNSRRKTRGVAAIVEAGRSLEGGSARYNVTPRLETFLVANAFERVAHHAV